MAGRGPAPKAEAQRRNFTKPKRGEWVDLPAENTAKPPVMPRAPRGGWATGTRSAWRAWWCDPASLMWSPADRSALEQLATLHHDLERGKISLAGEVRLRMDSLGLTQKGKRDFRWRIVEPAAEKPAAARSSRRGNLRVVGA